MKVTQDILWKVGLCMVVKLLKYVQESRSRGVEDLRSQGFDYSVHSLFMWMLRCDAVVLLQIVDRCGSAKSEHQAVYGYFWQ